MRALITILNNLFMRNNSLLLLAVILLGGNCISAVAGEARNDNIVSTQNNGSVGYNISLRTPDVEIQSVRINEKEYFELETQTDGFSAEPGLPSLPTFSRWIEVPLGTLPSLSLSTGSEKIISDIKIAPFPHGYRAFNSYPQKC